MLRGREQEGWPGSTPGCSWVQMEGEWKGAGPAPPPGPSPPSSPLRQAEGLPDPSMGLSLGWLPCAQGPLGIKVGDCGQAGTPFRRPLRPSCLSQHLSAAIFAQCPGNRETENLPPPPGGEEVNGTKHLLES